MPGQILLGHPFLVVLLPIMPVEDAEVGGQSRQVRRDVQVARVGQVGVVVDCQRSERLQGGARLRRPVMRDVCSERVCLAVG